MDSSFSYHTTHTVVDNFLPASPLMYAGCISTFPEASGATTVVARGSDDILSATVVSGPITMWGQPIEVAFQRRDLPFYATSTSEPVPLSTASLSTKARPSSMPNLPAATTGVSIDQLKTSISVLSANGGGGSTSVSAVGSLCFTMTGTFLVAMALVLLWRRWQKACSDKQRTMDFLVKCPASNEAKNSDTYV